MNRIFSFVLIAAGLVLLTMGLIESDSVASDFSRLFTDEPTDRAIWLILSGAIATLAGLGGFTMFSRGSSAGSA